MPIPGSPASASNGGSFPARCRSTSASSDERPTRGIIAGSTRGVPTVPGREVATEARNRCWLALASNRVRLSGASWRAVARRSIVSRRGAMLAPLSSLRRARTERPARSANCSWVICAARRYSRSRSAKVRDRSSAIFYAVSTRVSGHGSRQGLESPHYSIRSTDVGLSIPPQRLSIKTVLKEKCR